MRAWEIVTAGRLVGRGGVLYFRARPSIVGEDAHYGNVCMFAQGGGSLVWVTRRVPNGGKRREWVESRSERRGGEVWGEGV